MDLYANVIGEGKPMLILHGLFGMGDNWKTIGKRFAEEAGFQVHLIDQRNHGRSPHTETWNYEVMAEDIKDYIDKNDLKDIVLIGHSMGGKTGMHFAVKYPDLITTLIVVDIAPKPYPPHHQTIINGLTALEKEELTSRRGADEKLSASIDDWGTRQFLLKNLYWKEKGKLAFRMNLPVIRDNIEEVGKAIGEDERFEGWTLFVKGENSDYIQEGDEELIENHFPDSQLLPISGSGHWIHAEKPDALFDSVTEFIDYTKSKWGRQ